MTWQIFPKLERMNPTNYYLVKNFWQTEYNLSTLNNFKSISNAAFEVIGFFYLYEECIPCVINILLVKFYLPLIATFKPHVYSHTNYTLAQIFAHSYHTVRMPSNNHSISRTSDPEQTQLYNHPVNIAKRITKIRCKKFSFKNKSIRSLSLALSLSPMISLLVSLSQCTLYYQV